LRAKIGTVSGDKFSTFIYSIQKNVIFPRELYFLFSSRNVEAYNPLDLMRTEKETIINVNKSNFPALLEELKKVFEYFIKVVETPFISYENYLLKNSSNDCEETRNLYESKKNSYRILQNSLIILNGKEKFQPTNESNDLSSFYSVHWHDSDTENYSFLNFLNPDLLYKFLTDEHQN
jgi:hypothetical protein